MNLYRLLQKRLAAGPPVRVGLIGAGKFGSMFLSQAPTTPGLRSRRSPICPPTARGTPAAGSAGTRRGSPRTRFTDDSARDDRGGRRGGRGGSHRQPRAGIAHALAAFAAGKHVVMVNVEADVLAGPLLAREAAQAGVVYSLAYGDQPALICEMVDWARACGFGVVAAGKGTKYLPEYHASTPDTVWGYYGLTPEQARERRDEPADVQLLSRRHQVGDRDGGGRQRDRADPAARRAGLPALRRRRPGRRAAAGQRRGAAPRGPGGGRFVPASGTAARWSSDLRWGVYVVFEAPNDYAARCFGEYGVLTDPSGRFAAHVQAVPPDRPGAEHLGRCPRRCAARRPARRPGSAATWWRPPSATCAPARCWTARAATCVWGRLMPAAESLRVGGLPIGLANRVPLVRDVPRGQPSPGTTSEWTRRTRPIVTGARWRRRFRRRREPDHAAPEPAHRDRRPATGAASLAPRPVMSGCSPAERTCPAAGERKVSATCTPRAAGPAAVYGSPSREIGSQARFYNPASAPPRPAEG